MAEIKILQVQETDLPELVRFCDREIGENYYSLEDLTSILELSRKDQTTTSFLARNHHQEIVAVRLTYAPGNWTEQIPHGLTKEAWEVPDNKVAYFKSLFISDGHRGQGLGPKLSALSIEAVKDLGAQAIVCHSWLQSPGNTSQRYLAKMGFRPVQEHPLFWHHIDYRCTVCGDKRCECTALEMILYL